VTSQEASCAFAGSLRRQLRNLMSDPAHQRSQRGKACVFGLVDDPTGRVPEEFDNISWRLNKVDD
jgi:hypothetical protein